MNTDDFILQVLTGLDSQMKVTTSPLIQWESPLSVEVLCLNMSVNRRDLSTISINLGNTYHCVRLKSLKVQLKNISCANLIKPGTDQTAMAKHFDGPVNSFLCHYFSIFGTSQHVLIFLIDIIHDNSIWANQVYPERTATHIAVLTCVGGIRKVLYLVANKEVEFGYPT